MKNFNFIIIEGHNVNIPEHKIIKHKTQTKFSLAIMNEYIDDKGIRKRSCDFLRIVYHGEFKAFKGTPLRITGRLVIRKYQGKDKIDYYVQEIHADYINFITENEAK